MSNENINVFRKCDRVKWIDGMGFEQHAIVINQWRNQVEVERTDYYGNGYRMTMFTNQLVKEVTND
jgi:hypothetical protein